VPVAYHLVVTGRVQGIGYRESCRHQAGMLGVAGWVRNCPDGSVEAHLEGEPDAVEALVRWCRSGPRWAEVRGCTTTPADVEGLAGFRVR